MSRGEFNNAYGSGATVTSARFYPRGQHKALTFRITSSRAITWMPYAVNPQTGGRKAMLGAARAVVAGASDEFTVEGSRDAIEVDVVNTDATAGTYTWAFAEDA